MLPVVVPGNPNLKQLVGDFIFPYVENFVGKDRAGKVTGILLDMPQDEIKAYLCDFRILYNRIGEVI